MSVDARPQPIKSVALQPATRQSLTYTGHPAALDSPSASSHPCYMNPSRSVSATPPQQPHPVRAPQTIDAIRTYPTDASGPQTALTSTSPLFGTPHRIQQPGARSPKRGDVTCMHPFEDSMIRMWARGG